MRRTFVIRQVLDRFLILEQRGDPNNLQYSIVARPLSWVDVEKYFTELGATKAQLDAAKSLVEQGRTTPLTVENVKTAPAVTPNPDAAKCYQLAVRLDELAEAKKNAEKFHDLKANVWKGMKLVPMTLEEIKKEFEEVEGELRRLLLASHD